MSVYSFSFIRLVISPSQPTPPHPPSPPPPLLKTNAQLERNLERNRFNEINTNIFFKGYNSKSAMCKLGNEYVIMTKRNILHTIWFAFRSNHIRDRC